MHLNTNLPEQKMNEFTSQDRLGESPIWDHRRGFLFWVDIDNGIIHSLEPESKQFLNYSIHEKIGCLALAGERDFILATESGFYLWNPESNNKKLLSLSSCPIGMLLMMAKLTRLVAFGLAAKV